MTLIVSLARLTLASNQVMAQSETGYLRTVPWSSENIDGNVLNPIPILALDDNERHICFPLFDYLMDPPHGRSTCFFMSVKFNRHP